MGQVTSRNLMNGHEFEFEETLLIEGSRFDACRRKEPHLLRGHQRSKIHGLPGHHNLRDIARKAALYQPRKHVRTVFREVCQPYYSCNTLVDMLSILRDGVIALQALWVAGYVHRDISIGNLMLDTGQGRRQGRLSDLEFVKTSGDPSTQNVKTGTPHFMAIEVAFSKYMFLPQVRTRTKHPRSSVQHNPLHDLESVWWMATWTCFGFLPSGDLRLDDEDDLNGQREIFHDLFPQSLKPSVERTN
ncbi:hypothetical protein CPB83DRAFT_531206 [Crepidotus variabilis]|uniref:Protein kinase domain-containing protein n=1 Tax=Crepidotus variabilis TaxID=179855 RepID=A0A9P6JV51_9AGAR|nr:hypothetical protein CPB83DRAFT_531206 [Crepidotus variabilis]